MITVGELKAVLDDIHNDSAAVVVKDADEPDKLFLGVKKARYERNFAQIVQDENEETKAEYEERVALVI